MEKLDTYMIWGRYFTLIDRHDGPMGWLESCHRKKLGAYDSKPTPKPLIVLPRTIIGIPVVNVWIAPPIAKTTAPINRVPLRPSKSPTRPAATDVTVRQLINYSVSQGLVKKHTECANFEDSNHDTQLTRTGIAEILAEMGTGDNPGHDAAIG